MWENLHMNISDTMVPSEYDFLKSIGFKKLRVPAADYRYPNDTLATDWKAVASLAASKGFYVIHGVAGASLTSSTINDFATALQTHCDWCVSNGIAEFQIGNEEEYHHDASITDQQIRDFVRNQASIIRSKYGSRIKISYAAYHAEIGWVGEVTGGKTIDQVLGSLDYISSNNYGWSFQNTDSFKNEVYPIKNTFGDRCYISEWGVTSDWNSVKNECYPAIASEVKKRRDYLKSIGIPGFFYIYNYGNTDNRFSCRNFDGTYNAMWYALIDSRVPTPYRTPVSGRTPVTR